MENLWRRVRQPPWRTVIPGVLIVILVPLSYLLWSPGKSIKDGRYDLGQNGIWLQHGWLGDDEWFKRNEKTDRIPEFRSRERVRELAEQLRAHHITDVFPHVAPCDVLGPLPGVDDVQTEMFLDEFAGFRVMPWIGGVFGYHARPFDERWRVAFVKSVVELLERHPRLAGVHLNVEPMTSGNADFLTLLDELRVALPSGKLISIAAYPPPTRWHPFPDVHWEETYFREVARRSDQMAVMMYDTSLRYEKLYRNLMADWTRECLEWSEGTPVLLGLAAYDDAETEYHRPEVENLRNGLLGIHSGLASYSEIPPTYQGVALYREWEMEPIEWNQLKDEYLRPKQGE